MPRLIVNADDLGLTSGVNRAILRAHVEGIVTSTTLMANVPAFDEAVQMAGRRPELGVGCHIVLVDGQPLSPAESVRSLLDGDRFHRKLWKFALAAVRGKIKVSEVEAEATAQIRKLQKAGVALTHVDCHKHAHMFPPVLEGVLRACKATGVGAIRNPFEPGFARSGSAVRSMETGTLHAMYAKQFVARVREFGVATTDGSVGITATGTLDAARFAAIIAKLPAGGTFEFVCHPGYNDRELAAAGTRLLTSRETELDLLCSAGAREQLQRRGVELVNFRQLGASAESKVAPAHPMS